VKVAILDVRQGVGRKPENSLTVAYRNLMVLRDHFDADLLVNVADVPKDCDYDIIICGFGSTSCERDISTDFLVRNKGARLFWLVGEYEQSTFAPLFYSRREFEVIKNFEHKIKNKMCIRQHFLNINTLLARPQNRSVEKQFNAVYYGRWRPDRLRYFQQYLDSTIHLSTHSKNIKMFHHNGCNPRLIKPLGWKTHRETLNLFRTSLYIEDEFTHNHYNCLANRFYEALFCNCAPLFDQSCMNTLEKSGLKGYDWHIVASAKDVAEKANSIDADCLKRISRWNNESLKERAEVLGAMDKIFRGQ